MYGYTTKMSIDLIDEICDSPSDYKKDMIQQALNDAKVHYEYGNASKAWYDSVCRTLNCYL